MRLVIALGGNALIRRGEPPTAETQRENIRRAVAALAPLAAEHDLVLTHGNGPQVGLLAQQSGAGGTPYPLDVLDAETEGMIGYLIEQEMRARLPDSRPCAALLTLVEVSADDPAFQHPTKPVGTVFDAATAQARRAALGWQMAPDGQGFRRVVPSPAPQRILDVDVIALLVGQGVVVICAGGGGIPVVRLPGGALGGVECVIDKDRVSALLARELEADALLLLTDVPAVQDGWGTETARAFQTLPAEAADRLAFAAGSMGPKVEAAVAFARATGRPACIGALEDAEAVLRGTAGTRIVAGDAGVRYWEGNGRGGG